MPDASTTDAIVGNLIGGGTVGAALIVVLWRILSRIADRFIAAFDRLSAKIEEQTKELGSQREQLAEMRGEILGINWERDRTPPPHEVDIGRTRTPARGSPIVGPGYRAPTKGGRDG